MFNPLAGAISLTLAMLLAYGMTYGISLWLAREGIRLGVVSEVTDRSSHTRPTPRLGGVALFAGIAIPSALFVLLNAALPRDGTEWGGNLALLGWLLAGGAAMFAVGLADDLWDLPPLVKLAGEAVAVAPIFLAPLRFINLEVGPVPGISPPMVQALLAACWVLFFVNAFNFMDGMDGFAARFAMIVCMALFIAALASIAVLLRAQGFHLTDFRLELLMLPIIGSACGGFYRVNRSPAGIFMGDSGSLFLGYCLAVQVMLADGGYYAAPASGVPKPEHVLPASVVWILLLPFMFDVVLTILRRASRGENLLAAHRSHLYQRLMITGMSHRETLLLNLHYFRLIALIALLYAGLPALPIRVGLWIAAFGLMIHYWITVLRRERGVSPLDSGSPRR